MLNAGAYLASAGFPVSLYRRPGHALPREVDGPWAWPAHRRCDRLRPSAPVALSIAPAWGITGAPGGAGPLRRAGPWAEEVVDLEHAYGEDRLVHVSLEEFARTLTTREETIERFREGGVPAREIPRRLAAAEEAGELASFRTAFRTFRAFDRPNVLHLFAGLRYAPRFAREHPESVQTGPLWPWPPPRATPSGTPPRRPRRVWLWYASPASSAAILPEVERGLAPLRPMPRLEVRSPRPLVRTPSGSLTHVTAGPVGRTAWRRAFRDAELRIVTGSRSLLEALQLGAPFLYFNGVLADGRRRRRHRPEKVRALLALARDAGWPETLRADLDAFSRGRRIADVVERAGRREDGWRSFPPAPAPVGYAPGYEDAGAVIVRCANELARQGGSAAAIVARFRERSHR